MRKVLVLGIDGGSLDLVEQWKNELPNLKVFLENGVYGTLGSTIPPMTSPAWNCMFTGKNPAKIGFYDFWVISFDKKKLRIVNSTYQDSPYLWETLSDSNVKVGIVNVPNTFPARKVHGFMVCGGMLNVLLRKTEQTYPATLWEEINKAVKGYEILPLIDFEIPGKEKEYFNESIKCVNKQVEAVKYLMKRFPWDFMTYVIFETDTVQHYFWHHMDPNHPKWNLEKSKKYGNAIKDFYVKTDSLIGEIIKECPSETNIIIVSDHGFGPLYGYFCVNEWLKEKGYLKARSQNEKYNARDAFRKLLQTSTNFILAHLSNRLLRKFLRIFPKNLLQEFTFRGQAKNTYERLFADIDYSQTKAYGLRMGIFINCKGRDPDGIIEPGKEYEKLRNEIMEALYQIRHPITGDKVVTQVFKKEQVYSGKYLGSAPDLVYCVDDMKYRPIEGLNYGKLFIESPLNGDHRLKGMFMAHGPDIRKTGNKIPNIKIYDITPTILHIFGTPIPEDIDGRVLMEIFEDNSEMARRPIVYRNPSEKEFAGHKKEVLSDEDEEKIKERLRRLGYL